jgi:hypothetical protein
VQDEQDVEQTLAVIRKLMERGQRYEAVTGRGALVAGVVALAACALLEWGPWGPRPDAFVATWLVIALAAAAWTGLPALRASRRETRRVSPQAISVGLAVVPAYVAAAVLTAVLWRAGYVDLLPPAWMLLHGVAILATSYHAPERLVRLGVAFLVLGALTAFVALDRDLEMALSFGALNVAYGALALARPLPEPD